MKIVKKAKSLLKDNMKQSAFLTGALVLAVAGIACRILGVILRIPLTNIVGNYGMGLYQMVFPLYALLLIVSSAGFPVAVSKMVAREKVNENLPQCKKILFNALVLLGGIGLIMSSIFIIFSHQIASLQGNREVGIIYIAVAPSVFLVCLISAFRGYFQGLQNMIPTAVSQIIEQLIKLAAGITLALIFIKTSVVMAVFGAILAVTISEAVALIFLGIVYLKIRNKKLKKQKLNQKEEIHEQEKTTDKQSTEKKTKSFRLDKVLMKQILKTSLPITLMASVFPLILVFDSLVIIRLLKAAGESHKSATQLFGIQSGVVHTLVNLPAVLGVALATAVVPTVTSLIKQKKYDELRTKCALAVKLIFVIAVFFTVFYLMFSGQIIDLLYHSAFKDNVEHFKIARNLLKIESAMIALMGISQVFTAMLQAGDRSHLPLIALGIGGALKIVFELIFITTPMGVYAVSVSNVICFTVASLLNTIFALRTISIKPQLKKAVLKASALITLFAAFLIGLNILIPKGRWWLIPIGLASFLFFGVLVFLLKLFDKNEKNVLNKLETTGG